jgi:hypothetical protein
VDDKIVNGGDDVVEGMEDRVKAAEVPCTRAAEAVS